MQAFIQPISDFFHSIFSIESLLIAVEAIFKLVIAALFSGIIGFEREHSHRPAGFRTHILVAVGSALVMMTSQYIFNTYSGISTMDPARLGAQVISGIGFLGAGTILREGFTVKGLTTAASLWAVSCIGLAVGIGYYQGAVIATIVIYITLNSLKKFMAKGSVGKNLYIQVSSENNQIAEITDIINLNGGSLRSFEVIHAEGEGINAFKKNKNSIVLKALLNCQNNEEFLHITDLIKNLDGVTDLYID